MTLFSHFVHPSFKFKARSYALLLRRRVLIPLLDANSHAIP